MTDRRAQIEARLAAATEGPWAAWTDQDGQPHMDGLLMVGNAAGVIPDGESWVEPDEGVNPIAHCYTPEDRALIAQAPADLRWLLDALAEAEAERDAQRRAAERWKEVADAADDVIRAVLAALYRGPDTDAVIRAKKVMAERDALAARLADPGPLLAALTEAGVLIEQRRSFVDGGPIDGIDGWERRYVTAWEATDG